VGVSSPRTEIVMSAVETGIDVRPFRIDVSEETTSDGAR
jgi:hypothetical protein